MRASDLLAALPTDEESAILDYLESFPRTWRRRPVLKDLVEHFRDREAVVERLRGLHAKGYLVRGASGFVEFQIPYLGEIQ